MRSRLVNVSVRQVALFFFLVALLAGTAGVAKAASQVPQFALPTVTDKTLINVENYRGKVVLINFWATWCPPCRKEIPYLVRLYKEFGDKGFMVLGISVDEGGERVVKNFVEKQEIPYPVMLATDEVLRKFGGIAGVPYSFLVDKNGNVVKSYPGYVAYQILRNDISMLFY